MPCQVLKTTTTNATGDWVTGHVLLGAFGAKRPAIWGIYTRVARVCEVKLRYIDEKVNKEKHQADMNHEILIGSWRSFLKKSLSKWVGFHPLYTDSKESGF